MHVARVAVRVAVRVGRRVRREVAAYLVEWAEAQEEGARRGVEVEGRVRRWVGEWWEGYKVRRHWV